MCGAEPKWRRKEMGMSLQQAITEFRGQFRGAVIEPEDPDYDEAEKSITR